MAKKGDVTYELRADDSHLESDLNEAEKKIKKSTKQTTQTAEKEEKQSSEVKKEIKEEVTKHHEEQNRKQEESDRKSHEEREDSAKQHGEKLKSIASGSAKAIGAGMMAVGTAAVAIGGMAVNSAVSMDQAMNGFIASTGKGVEETERYQNVLENIYKNNYGEDFQDIADAMGNVTKTLGELDDTSLQEVTESAFALRDTFEYEIAESTKAAKAMMDNFGISGQNAMNLIATGAQNGLDYSGELLDSISEYSVHFGKIGMDADDMFKIFQTGAESGAFSLDKIGDAVKEMSIRVIDGSESTKQGFEAIGLNADEMAAKFAAGGDNAKEAFEQTVAALASIEDPLAQNNAGVALFGTMWEDLGPNVVSQLANIKSGAYATGQELNNIKNVKYDDLGSMFEGLTRAVEMLLLPLGEELIPILSEVIEAALPIVEEVLPVLVEIVGELLGQLAPVIEDLLPLLLDLFDSLLPPLMDLISAILPVIVDLFSSLIPPVVQIIEAVLPVLIELINVLLPIFQLLIDLLMPVIDLFIALLQPILTLISQALTPLVEALTPIIETIIDALIPAIELMEENFTDIFEIISELISDNIESWKSIFDSVVDFINNVFSGNWEAAWENIKDIFGEVIGGLERLFKTPINAIVDGWNNLARKLGAVEIPDWVPGVGGGTFSLPTLPRLKIGMDYVPSDDYPALLHRGEAVLTAEENDLLRSLGGIAGVERLISVMAVSGPTSSGGIDRELASAILKLAKLADRPVAAYFNVNGRTLSKTIAEPMNEEIQAMQKLENMLKGER